MLNYFGVSKSDAPTARIINMETGKKFTLSTGEFTTDSLMQLCQEVVDGSAKVTDIDTHTERETHSHTAALNSVTHYFLVAALLQV